jgi:plastocyanin
MTTNLLPPSGSRTVTASPSKKVSSMSLVYDGIRAFAAGAAVSCVIYGAVAAMPTETHITIDNFSFKAATVTVPAGTTVVWENGDDIAHNVVALDGTFRSQALDTEDKFSFTFATAGTYEYFCSLHPRMKGEIVVTP